MISVVIPAFNEEGNIRAIHEAIGAAFGGSEQLEFVFVDDGSSDVTSNCVRELRAGNHSVRLIRFGRNFGHQAAVSAGIDHALGDAVAIMDADLQDPPEVLLAMLEKWREGFEVVYGVRRSA